LSKPKRGLVEMADSKTTRKHVTKLLAGLTEQQKVALEQIKKLLGQRDLDLKDYHEIGRCVSVIRGTEHGSGYGQRRVPALNKLLKEDGLHCTPTLLYRAHQFKEMYSPEEARRLSRQLSWEQMVLLMRIKDAATREQLQKQAIEKDWSIRDLRKKIDDRVGSGSKELRRLARLSKQLFEVIGTRWLGQNAPLLAELTKARAAKPTPKLRGEVRKAEKALGKVSKAAEKLSKSLTEVASKGWNRPSAKPRSPKLGGSSPFFDGS
jgi:hypothetical protein